MMFRKLILLGVVVTSIGLAQNPYNTDIDLKGYFNAATATMTAPFVPVTTDPTGTGCTPVGSIVENTTNGDLVGCVSISGTPTWTLLNITGSITFAQIASGTNTTMAAVCDTGCSIATTGTGSIQGTSLNGLPGVPYSVYGPVGTAPTVPSGEVGCWFNASDVTQHCIDHTTNASVMMRGLATPGSSTATCTPPQVSYDLNYLYACTASNTWSSIPWAAFQGAWNNQAGTITVTAATSASTTFTVPYNSAPICTLTSTSDPTASIRGWVTTSTTAVTAHLSGTSTITYNYTCTGNPN